MHRRAPWERTQLHRRGKTLFRAVSDLAQVRHWVAAEGAVI